MEAVREVRKKYCPPALFIAIIIAMVLIFTGHRDMARGLVLGTLFSIANFVLMGMSVQMKLRKSRRASSIMSLLLVLARFSILAVPLIIAIYYDRYHILTTIIGLFMVQAMIVADALRKMVTSRYT